MREQVRQILSLNPIPRCCLRLVLLPMRRGVLVLLPLDGAPISMALVLALLLLCEAASRKKL